MKFMIDHKRDPWTLLEAAKAAGKDAVLVLPTTLEDKEGRAIFVHPLTIQAKQRYSEIGNNAAASASGAEADADRLEEALTHEDFELDYNKAANTGRCVYRFGSLATLPTRYLASDRAASAELIAGQAEFLADLKADILIIPRIDDGLNWADVGRILKTALEPKTGADVVFVDTLPA